MTIINKKWDKITHEIREAYLKSHEKGYDIFKESAVNTSNIMLTIYWLILTFLWFFYKQPLDVFWKILFVFILLMITIEIAARNFRFLPRMQLLLNRNKEFYLDNRHLFREEIVGQKPSPEIDIEKMSDSALLQSYEKLKEWSRKIEKEIENFVRKLSIYRKITSLFIITFLCVLIILILAQKKTYTTMEKLQQDGPEEIVYKGKIFEVVRQPMIAGGKRVFFEIARRSPGTRLLIVDDNKLLITKEFRAELNGYDYRLPGGKVFDTLDEYNQHVSDDMLPFAIEAAKRECREETGLLAKHVKHFATAKSGATVVWDLIYVLIDDFEKTENGQELETGEVIEVEWKTFDEIKELCKNGSINEDRTLGVLFRFFLQYPERYTRE